MTNKHRLPSVDVVIPVYNEEKILEKSTKELREFLKKKFADDYSWKIVIADNASIDKTLDIAKKLKKRFSDVDYIHLDQKGRGRALRKAWTQSKADVVCYMDVDLSTDLNSLKPLIDAIAKDGYDISTGSRLMKGAKIKRSIKREILSRGYVLLLKTLLGIGFEDAQCGFKAVNKKIRKEVMPKVSDNEWFFDSELLFKAQKWGYKIKEIPVKWIEDPDSRVNIPRTVTNYIKSIFRLRSEFAKAKKNKK